MLEKSSIEKKACSKNLPPTNFDQSLEYLSRKKHRYLDYALERKSLDLSWKGLRVKKKKIACRGEQNRFPRFLATEIKQRIRVIVEYVSRTSVSRTSVHTDGLSPTFFESTWSDPTTRARGDSTRERVWALLGAGRACPTIGGSDRRGCFASFQIAPFVSDTF